jgi:Domain of unknown function (DUF4407)
MTTPIRYLLYTSGLYMPGIDNEDNRHLVGWYVNLALALWFSVFWAFAATFYTTFELTHNKQTAGFIACLIASFIYIAERSILNTPKTGIWLQDVKSLIPRIVITAVINIAFSHAVMIRIFENKITVEQQKMALDDKSNIENELNTQLEDLNVKLKTLDQQLMERRNIIYASDAQLQEYKANVANTKLEIAQKEALVSQNNTLIGQNSNLESNYDQNSGIKTFFNVDNGTAKAKKDENRSLNSNIAKLNSEIKALEGKIENRKKELKPQTEAIEKTLGTQRTKYAAEIDYLTKHKDQKVADFIKAKAESADFWTKDEAMDRIKQKPDMGLKALIVLFILWCLDTSVLLMKLFGQKNGYDEFMISKNKLSKMKYDEILDNAQKTIDSKLDELNQILEANKNLNLTINREKIEAELRANKELTDLAAEKAAKLVEIIVNKWFEDEKYKIINATNFGTNMN